MELISVNSGNNSNHFFSDRLNKPLLSATPIFFQSFKKWTWIIITITGVIQLSVWPTTENLFAVFSVVLCWALLDSLMLKYTVLNQYPLSCFMVLGFVLTQSFFPLVFTILEGRPISFNLKVPYLVFLHSTLAVITIISAHFAYRSLLKRQPFFYNAIQRKMINVGFFRTPSNRQIWILGFIGLAAMFYVYFYSPSVGNEVTGAGNKFVQGLIPFTYAPFYILIKKMYGVPGKKNRFLILYLSIFVVLLFVVSIGRNSRGAFMFGFTGLIFGYFLGLLLAFFSPKIINRRNLIVASITFWLLTGPLSDLGVAMVIVRGQRAEINRVDLLKLTFEKYQSKKEIALYKKSALGKDITGWDEQYLDNIFLARFCNLKFNDASLEISEKLGRVDPIVNAYAIERPLAIFPKPVIDFWGLKIDKERVNSSSSGDVLFDRVGGGNALGGFRVGHFAGFGMASFGWFYLIFLFVLIIPAFFLWDLLVIRFRSTKSGKRELVFSLAALLSLTELFCFINFENVLYILQFLFRGWIQMIFLYWVLLQITRILSGITLKR